MKTKETSIENQLNHKVNGVKLKTTREQAMAYWVILPLSQKEELMRKHKIIGFQMRTPRGLTGREIEEIWLKETAHIDSSDIESTYMMQFKPNQELIKKWYKLTLEERFYKVIPWLRSKGLKANTFHPNDLSDNQIEEIMLKDGLSLEEKPCTDKIVKAAMKVTESEVRLPKVVRDGIVKEEYAYVENPFPKPNQKQFKQFDEALFKAYIDKFSNEDLYKAHKILKALRSERIK